MSDVPEKIQKLELFAWVGEDDQKDVSKRTGQMGLKQGLCPAGYIPLVAVRYGKVARFADGMEAQALAQGKRIRLVRFVFAEVLYETEAGE